MVCNSERHEASVIKLELSFTYPVWYILGEHQGNPAMLIN